MHQRFTKHLGILFIVLSLLLNPIMATPVYAAPSAPVPLAPSNGATTTVATNPPLAVPEFQWTAVATATSYRLQVASDSGFVNKVVDITTPNTSYTPDITSTLSDGTYYWHVRVEASPTGFSDYSTLSTFTKQWAAPDNEPVLVSPDDGQSIDFYDAPYFSWQPVTGAAKYKLQVYSSPGGWSTLSMPLVTTLSTTHQPTLKLANGTYYWRVIPVDSGNHDGTPSAERSFVATYNFVPTLLEPADSTNPTFTPTFRWTAVRGAQFYRLQYSTDPNFPNNSLTTTVDTRNTSHTPVNALANDKNYYWHVMTVSGSSSSQYSPTRVFQKKWYIKPVPLTPVDSYQQVRFPLFSWTPVPGASYYKVELDDNDPNFSNPIFDTVFTANTFATPSRYLGSLITYYWRVTPYDGNGQAGQVSDTASYQSYSTSLAPQLVFPFYYYPPDTYANFPGISTNPHEDRTVSLPIFVWHRVYKPASDPNQGDVYAQAYRVQVSTDATFTGVNWTDHINNWTVDTQNTMAAPTAANPFTPLPDTDYYWRVRPLIGGNEVAFWSQIWRVQFDTSKGLTPTNGSVPLLIRPTTGFEYAEATPLLEWFPMNGATSYDVQISRDQAFSNIVNSATVLYPAYVPTQSLAQRSLGSLDFGVYYWRVRNSGSNTWSETRRFQIAAQSQWQQTRTLGATANRLQIGSDPAGDVANDFDLTNLHVAQSSSSWYFGFDVPSSPSQYATYALYLDLDHQDGSGATLDARGYSVTTISSYRPEYAIYIVPQSNVYSPATSYLYHWGGSSWDPVKIFTDIGGQLNKSGDHIELQLSNTSIGYQATTGSYAISLFSLPATNGQPPQDSVPSDPNVPGGGAISRFSNVTERMNLLMPPTNAGVDPTTYPSIQPFYWDWPILAPWAGANMKAYKDAQFTNEIATFTLSSDTSYYAQTSHAWGNDFGGDNTYYWRVQPRYLPNGAVNGVWTQGWSFERQGFVPQNLQTSVTFATPTFLWDMVEGAESYDLQVDDDPGFGSTAISITTRQNSYTDTGTLGNATYYWRVRVHRNGNIINDWSIAQSFTLALPVPTGLTPGAGSVVAKAPTLCWSPVLSSSGGNPVFAAWKYRVQVSKDNTFTSIWDTIDTEQKCWTPTKGYDDHDYYWHVAVLDGQGKLGNYSSGLLQKFTKQYPMTTLVSPAPGAALNGTPTFVWTPVNGAARYKLEVSKNPTFDVIYESVTTDNTRWTPKKTFDKVDYYWRVAIIDADQKVGPFVGSTIVSGNVSVDVKIGTTALGPYTLAPSTTTQQVYALDSGPVQVKSKNNLPILASERFVYTFNNSKSYAEMMGYPGDQLATEYWFPWYNNLSYSTQLRVSNMGSTGIANIKVYAGPTLLDTLPIAAGQGVRKSYTIDNGPLHVFSEDGVTPILVSERFIQTFMSSASYAEMMGYPGDQLTTEYWFPWYNNLSYSTQLRVSNLGGNTVDVNVYAGTDLLDTLTIQAGQGARKSYNVDNGPLHVVSTDGVTPILASERFIQTYGTSASYAEMMGYPADQLTTQYCFPWYNTLADGGLAISTQLRVSNMSNNDVQVKVYLAGQLKDSFPILVGQGARKTYASTKAGPLCVESTDGISQILASERFISTYLNSSSYSEMMGYPTNQLASTYWFPWYNNLSYSTELRIARP